MAKIGFTARVAIMVEIDVSSEHWNEQTPAEQLHREGKQIGIDRIRDLCTRSYAVRLIGDPTCQMILFDKKG
jgi:hypothetical protein